LVCLKFWRLLLAQVEISVLAGPFALADARVRPIQYLRPWPSFSLAMKFRERPATVFTAARREILAGPRFEIV